MPGAGNRLALGTAQFGLDYGLNNRRGRIPEAETAEILACAAENGVDTLDTAEAYGDSETLLGRLDAGRSGFRLVSKLPPCTAAEAERHLKDSCRRLGVAALDGYLVHSFEAYRADPKILEALRELKSQGLVRKVGFSVYRPEELAAVLDRGEAFDLVQLPCSLLDRRFLPQLAGLKKMGIEVHARSVFLQGLLLRDPSNLPPRFTPVRGALEKWRELADQHGLPLAAICLDFVLAQESIDRVVIGVDGLSHFHQNLSHAGLLEQVRRLLPELPAPSKEEAHEQIILPSNWK